MSWLSGPTRTRFEEGGEEVDEQKSSASGSARIRREQKTVAAMIEIYCHALHRSADAVCPECFELLEYAHKRLLKCPFHEEKPACADCHVHCYSPQMRARMQEVMRFSGPRMLLRHPLLALRHYLDSRIAARTPTR